jgi:hypothetical protein
MLTNSYRNIKDRLAVEPTFAMRPLSAEEVSRVSGGMMNRGTGDPPAAGGSGDQGWGGWAFWH